MRYPNLTAEIEATGYKDGFAFNTLASVAGVTERLLRRIAWGNDSVTTAEACRLYSALTPYGNFNHFSLEYLFHGTLAVVAPGSTKSKKRTYTLRQLVSEAEILSPPHWWTEQRKHMRCTLSTMERGETVTYAAYRFAVNIAQHIISDRKQAAHRQVRDVYDIRKESGRRAKPKVFEPYSFLHTLAGNNFRALDKGGAQYIKAQGRYNQYLTENKGRLNKADIEAEAVCIVQQLNLEGRS